MLGPRYDDALRHAAQLHRTQTRKGIDVPYISHLLSVSALVIEYGGDEDQAIAGLLHDAIEDAGETRASLDAAYGPRVARTVAECSDCDGQVPRPDWTIRKRAYLDSIPEKSADAILVTACDKLHNATAILEDLHRVGLSVFDRFTAGKDGTLWYYEALAAMLTKRAPADLAQRLSRVVGQLQRTAAGAV